MDTSDTYGREGTTTRDVEAIRAYGAKHPDEYVDVRGERQDGFTLVALFTGERCEDHEAALRQLVSRPDRFEVRHLPFSRAHLDAVRATIADELRERSAAAPPGEHVWNSIGNAGGVVQVSLSASQEVLAADLRERFGDAVDVQLGRPVGLSGFAPPTSAKAPPEEPLPWPDDLVASLEEPLAVVSGRHVVTTLHVLNRGARTYVALTNGHLPARVVDPETLETVGGYVGFQAMPLDRFILEPGTSTPIPLLVGASSATGPGVATGIWAVVATLRCEDAATYVTPPFEVSVLPRED